MANRLRGIFSCADVPTKKHQGLSQARRLFKAVPLVFCAPNHWSPINFIHLAARRKNCESIASWYPTQ